MDNDFNIAPALAAVFRFTRRVNRIMDSDGLSKPDKEKLLKVLGRINSVLGVMDLETTKQDKNIDDLIEQREQARKNKAWDMADRLRLQLKEMGIRVIDTKEGPVWRKIKGD
jgi:cysteinyl-tRNA synthetase